MFPFPCILPIWNYAKLTCFIVVVAAEVDPLKSKLTRGANKMQEFSDRCVADKRKLLVGALGTQVEELFPNSLDKAQNMASDEAK